MDLPEVAGTNTEGDRMDCWDMWRRPMIMPPHWAGIYWMQGETGSWQKAASVNM